MNVHEHRRSHGAVGMARVLVAIVAALALSMMTSQAGDPRSGRGHAHAAGPAGAGAGLAARTGQEGGAYELWITNQARNLIQVVRDERIVAEIALDGPTRVPHIVTFSPDGRYAYLASVGLPGMMGTSGVTVIRTTDRTIVATITTGPGAHEAQVTPDGARVLVSVGGTRSILEVMADLDAERFEPTRALDVGLHPLVVAAGLEGQPVCIHFYAPGRAYVGFHHGGAALLDTTALDLLRVYTKEEVGPNRCAFLPLPDGRLMIGTGSEAAGGYVVWDPATERFVASVDTGQIDNHGGRLRPGAGEAWFVARGSDTLTIAVTAAPYASHSVLPLGDAPDHLVFSPDGRWAFVTLRGPEPLTGGPIAAGQTPGLAVVDADARTVVRLIDLGGGDPHWIALRAVPRG